MVKFRLEVFYQAECKEILRMGIFFLWIYMNMKLRLILSFSGKLFLTLCLYLVEKKEFLLIFALVNLSYTCIIISFLKPKFIVSKKPLLIELSRNFGNTIVKKKLNAEKGFGATKLNNFRRMPWWTFNFVIVTRQSMIIEQHTTRFFPSVC